MREGHTLGLYHDDNYAARAQERVKILCNSCPFFHKVTSTHEWGMLEIFGTPLGSLLRLQILLKLSSVSFFEDAAFSISVASWTKRISNEIDHDEVATNFEKRKTISRVLHLT